MAHGFYFDCIDADINGVFCFLRGVEILAEESRSRLSFCVAVSEFGGFGRCQPLEHRSLVKRGDICFKERDAGRQSEPRESQSVYSLILNAVRHSWLLHSFKWPGSFISNDTAATRDPRQR